MNPRSDTDFRKIDVTDDENDPPSPAAADLPLNDTEDDGSKLQSDLERFRDLALRSQADFDNFKKRAVREKEDAIKYANSSLLERLIAIVDNFELGLSAAKNESADSPILAGMGMVLKQLTDFLAENGLQPIVADRSDFDPTDPCDRCQCEESSEAAPDSFEDWRTADGVRSTTDDRVADTGSGVADAARRGANKVVDAVDNVKDRIDGNPASKPGPDPTDKRF